jgi:hypothetical protein
LALSLSDTLGNDQPQLLETLFEYKPDRLAVVTQLQGRLGQDSMAAKPTGMQAFLSRHHPMTQTG